MVSAIFSRLLVGYVLKMKSNKNGMCYAVRRSLFKSQVITSEVRALWELRGHPNFVYLHNYFFSRDLRGWLIENLVMDCYQYNLRDYMRFITRDHYSIPIFILKDLVYNVLTGLKALHEKHWVHRELNPHHILYDVRGYVAITGLKRAKKARLADDESRFTSEFRFLRKDIDLNGYKMGAYKAPELICGCRYYDYSVDMWCKYYLLNPL